MSVLTAERLVAIVPLHWVRYLRLGSIFVILAVGDCALFLLAGFWSDHVEFLSNATFVLACLLLLFLHHWAFLTLGGESVRSILVTSQRVVYFGVRLLRAEELRDISLTKAKSVEVHMNGFIPHLLRYGTITFEGHNAIKDIPHPHRVAREIEQVLGLL